MEWVAGDSAKNSFLSFTTRCVSTSLCVLSPAALARMSVERSVLAADGGKTRIAPLHTLSPLSLRLASSSHKATTKDIEPTFPATSPSTVPLGVAGGPGWSRFWFCRTVTRTHPDAASYEVKRVASADGAYLQAARRSCFVGWAEVVAKNAMARRHSRVLVLI